MYSPLPGELIFRNPCLFLLCSFPCRGNSLSVTCFLFLLCSLPAGGTHFQNLFSIFERVSCCGHCRRRFLFSSVQKSVPYLLDVDVSYAFRYTFQFVFLLFCCCFRYTFQLVCFPTMRVFVPGQTSSQTFGHVQIETATCVQEAFHACHFCQANQSSSPFRHQVQQTRLPFRQPRRVE